MAELRQQDGVAARAPEFEILTARARSLVPRGTRSIFVRLWIIPAEHMKVGREHRVSLTDASMAILEKLRHSRGGDFI